jgi:hypothetical protein
LADDLTDALKAARTPKQIREDLKASIAGETHEYTDMYPGMAKTARTEGFIRGRPDIDETIRRLKAFADAGADCLYSPGIKTREHIEATVKAVGAKAINFLLTNGGKMQDYWGVGKATGPLLPMIAVPTTAGTGSETQSYALIADASTHTKMETRRAISPVRLRLIFCWSTLVKAVSLPVCCSRHGATAQPRRYQNSVIARRVP